MLIGGIGVTADNVRCKMAHVKAGRLELRYFVIQSHKSGKCGRKKLNKLRIPVSTVTHLLGNLKTLVISISLVINQQQLKITNNEK